MPSGYTGDSKQYLSYRIYYIMQTSLSLAELKGKSPADLLSIAEQLEIENASTMRKGDMMFCILKEKAEDGIEISGDGVL